jgi:hypothetical protein
VQSEYQANQYQVNQYQVNQYQVNHTTQEYPVLHMTPEQYKHLEAFLGRPVKATETFIVAGYESVTPTGAPKPDSEPQEEEEEDDERYFHSGWSFDFNVLTFRYKKSKWHKTTRQKLSLLRAFVNADPEALSKEEIEEACGNKSSGRHAAYVGELNAVLEKAFKLRVRPIKPTARGSGRYWLNLSVLDKSTKKS